MKYLCLVYGEEKDIGAMTDDECMAYDQALRSAGRCLASEALSAGAYRSHGAGPKRQGGCQGWPVH